MRYTINPEQFTVEAEDGSALSWFDDDGFALLSRWWLQASWQRRYSYQFKWLGQPIIQLPTDILMMQDVITRVRPTVIIETGVAHGGSAIFHASMLLPIHHGESLPPDRPRVVAIDVDIRADNRRAIDRNPMASLIRLIEGDSIDDEIVERASTTLRPDDVVLVVLDSCHTADHVLAEMKAYGPLVSPGSAMVVMDGIMPDLAGLPGGDDEWNRDHPGSAIDAFLNTEPGRAFAVDTSYEHYAVTHSPGGVLIREAR